MNTPAALVACPGTVTYQCSNPTDLFVILASLLRVGGGWLFLGGSRKIE